jgi:hypothetical protein
VYSVAGEEAEVEIAPGLLASDLGNCDSVSAAISHDG